MQILKLTKTNLIVIIFITIIAILSSNYIVMASTEVKSAENQYMELKATTIKEIDGKGKQVIFELWSYNIEFKGFDVRFSYDGTNLTPSNLLTNDETEDETEYFTFEDEFKSCLELFTIQYTGNNPDGIRAIVSFNPPVVESEHIKDKEGIGMVVDTTGGVLLGKMSFKITSEEFDISSFKLETSDNSSPLTGIKINIDGGSTHFENQSVFRFTNATASKDADLANLVLSSGKKDETNPDNSTYKEYNLTPIFNKNTLNYELTLLEYIDMMNITAIQNDAKANMKIKLPKRDENNNLIYDPDGTTIIYEEKDIENNVPLEFAINKLGEADTQITVIVTAEDGTNIKNYQLLIKRPYGVIKGQSVLADFDDENVVQNMEDIYGIQLSNKTEINLYKAGLAEWESITDIYGMVYDNPLTYEQLENIPKEMNSTSREDGTFEIYVIPGKYDVQINRLAYLDYIYSDVEILEGDIIDMGKFRMQAGDANRDGVISQEDVNEIKKFMDIDYINPDFSETYNPTQLGVVVAEDLGYAKQNQDEELQIIYFTK